MKKLAIITTHPIQYYAPVFKLLHARGYIEIKVFYTLGTDSSRKNDPGFGKKITWDIPLLEGYNYQWIQNVASKPGSANFNGVINPDLINSINEWDANAVLVFGWAYHSHLKALRYFKNKIPVYFRGDSTLLNETGGIKSVLKYFFLTWVYRHVDHVFYVGFNNKAYYEKYGLKHNQLSFAPHAVDNDRFKAKRIDDVASLRSSLKINDYDILILFAGKFEPVKNVELLLTAFIALKNTNLHLLLVGNGINEPLLKKQANESSVATNIHFLDFVNQTYIPVIYQAADIFCLPSKSESWGLSINEAMACKKAILASDRCGCAIDLVQDQRNGTIFKSGSLDNLIVRLKKLTENKALLADYGTFSGRLIQPWNFQNIAEAIEHQLINETI